MVQAWKVLTFTTLVAAGCGPALEQPIVRASLGANARQVAMPAPSSNRPASIARTTTAAPQPEEASQPLDSAVTGALQFSVRPVGFLYFGGEVEAGAFAREGSNYGGAYGVLGVEAGGQRAFLSLEVAAGRQWLRYDLNATDVGANVVEPRVRAQVLLNPQVSLGGMIGANAMPEERGWTAGLFLGIYSHPIDGSSRSDD
ncbi:MAG: hypothetical protein SFX73_22795 [Kofleriaceae bacterium]|nr:hypothetical protein [Kofleriaceae bacterium]